MKNDVMIDDKTLMAEDKRAANLKQGKAQAKAARKLQKERIHKTITLLQSIFPNAFKAKPEPLKCNINDDLILYWQAHETEMGQLSKKHLRATLQFYTSRLVYHEACLAEKAMRIDLAGTTIEAVTDNAKIYHQDCVNKIIALHKKHAEQRNKKTNRTVETQLQAADATGNATLTLKKKL